MPGSGRCSRELVAALVERAPAALDPVFGPLLRAAADDAARLRVVIDQVASLTDPAALAWHARLVGAAGGVAVSGVRRLTSACLRSSWFPEASCRSARRTDGPAAARPSSSPPSARSPPCSVLATPASAHGQFVSSDPAKDSTVSMPLASIVVYFTEKPTSNAFFSVTAPSGARVDRLWSHGSTRHLDEPVHEYYHNADGNWETRTLRHRVLGADPDRLLARGGRLQGQLRLGRDRRRTGPGRVQFAYDGALSPAPPDFRPQKNEPDPNLLAVAKTDQPTAPPSAGPEQAAQAAEDSGPGVWIVLVPVGLALIVAARDVPVLAVAARAARTILVSRFGGRYAARPAAAQAAAAPSRSIQRQVAGHQAPLGPVKARALINGFRIGRVPC